MRVLCTGGAGFIGAVLVPALLGAGHHVTVVDDFRYDASSLNVYCSNPRFEVIRADVRSFSAYARALTSADIFIPLAALVGAPICDQHPLEASAINYHAVRNILDCLSPAQQVLFPTTNSGYGISTALCTEDTPLKPLSLYARTKVDAERAVLDRGNSITFRLATAFGASPRMRIDLLLNNFVYRALNDHAICLFEAHFRRNFIHVADIASVFLHGIEHFEEMRGCPYNVGMSDANLTKWELCECIHRIIPDFVWWESPTHKDMDQRDYVVSNERIEATGWKPQHSLDDGIAELIKLYTFLRNERYGNVR